MILGYFRQQMAANGSCSQPIQASGSLLHTAFAVADDRAFSSSEGPQVFATICEVIVDFRKVASNILQRKADAVVARFAHARPLEGYCNWMQIAIYHRCVIFSVPRHQTLPGPSPSFRAHATLTSVVTALVLGPVPSVPEFIHFRKPACHLIYLIINFRIPMTTGSGNCSILAMKLVVSTCCMFQVKHLDKRW